MNDPGLLVLVQPQGGHGTLAAGLGERPQPLSGIFGHLPEPGTRVRRGLLGGVAAKLDSGAYPGVAGEGAIQVSGVTGNDEALLFHPLEHQAKRFGEIEPGRDAGQRYVDELAHVDMVGERFSYSVSPVDRESASTAERKRAKSSRVWTLLGSTSVDRPVSWFTEYGAPARRPRVHQQARARPAAETYRWFGRVNGI